MKKLRNIFMVVCALGATMFVVTSCTTSTTVTESYQYENTQARALDVTANGFVKPMCVDLVVDENAGLQVWRSDNLSKDFVEKAMRSDVQNIRSWGVFQASTKWGCDVVVAPTFHFFTNAQGGYTLEIRGYKGNFKNWKPASEKDLELVGEGKLITTTDRLQSGAVVKPAETPQTPQATEAQRTQRSAAAATATAGAATGLALRLLGGF